jgi:hypothetical protein
VAARGETLNSQVPPQWTLMGRAKPHARGGPGDQVPIIQHF